MKRKTAREIIENLESRFKPDEVPVGYETVVHLDIKGDNGGQFTVAISKDECLVTEGLVGVPKCTVKTKDTVYEKLEYGETKPQFAYMMGRVKVSSVSELLSFGKLFKRLKVEKDKSGKKGKKKKKKK